MRVARTIPFALVFFLVAIAAVPGQQQRQQQPVRGRNTLEERALSSTTSGTVYRGDTGEPVPGARVKPKPLKVPNAFDKPCKRSGDTDVAEGASVLTDDRGRYVLPGAPEPEPARLTARPATAEEETARRILEMERLRQQAERGVSVVDQRRLNQTALPQETINAILDPATVPLAKRQGVESALIPEKEGYVAAPWPGNNPGDLVLLPGPTLSGRVVDAFDKPVAGAVVQVYEVRTRPLGRTMKWVKSALTNDLGEYRVPWLEFGWYAVAAGYSSHVQQPWRDSLKLSPNLPEPDYGLPLMFYPGVENAPDAQLIHIKLPLSENSGMPAPVAHIALKERPRFNLKVRLVAERMPVNPTLVVVPAGGDVCAGMDFAIKSNGDGTFDVRDIPRGRYEMVAIRGRDIISALLPINVEKDMDDLKLAVSTPLTVQGTLTFEGLLPGTDINRLLGEIRVSLTRSRSEVSQVATSIADPRTFNFSIPGMGPGFYYPTVDLPPGAFIKDIHVAGVQRTGGSEDEWKCDALPFGTYTYLDTHGHLNGLELPRDLDTGSEKILLCLKIEISFSGHLAGSQRCLGPVPPPCAPYVAVLMPRSAWAASEDNGVTPPDRILAVLSGGPWEFFGLPFGDYRAYGVPFPSADLIYRREFHEWFGAWALPLLYDYVAPCPDPGAGDACLLTVPTQPTVDRVTP